MKVLHAEIVRIEPIRYDQRVVDITIRCPHCDKEHSIIASFNDFEHRFHHLRGRCLNEYTNGFEARWPGYDKD